MKKNGKAREFPLKGDGATRSSNLHPLMEYIAIGDKAGSQEMYDNFMSGKNKLKKKTVSKTKSLKNRK